MSEKCNPKYRNLNTIQSFSEQRYATVQWAEQNCENDEYLKQEVDELNYRSPARIRKRWNPILVDDNNSYGHQVNPDGTVTFSEKVSGIISIDFTDMSYVDKNKSDVVFKNYVDGNGVTHRSATIPKQRIGKEITNCRSLEEGTYANTAWYVGFDKSKPYHIRPDWIKDPFDSEIPSVCRAQTFMIPEKDQDGVNIVNAELSGVDLRIKNNGTTNSNWGSPLFVQLWQTKKVRVRRTQWDGNKKREVPTPNEEYDEIYYPSGTPKTALATCVFNPDVIQPQYQNFLFDKKVIVQGGEHYAIVMLSPLSHWEHCPRIAGWGRNCHYDRTPDGDAFLSEDNGTTWQRYGKTDLSIGEYNMGQLTPMDFRFAARMQMYTSGYVTDEDFYLYLKPIHLNPIKGLQLIPVGLGNEYQEENLKLEFQVSQSGKADDWEPLDPNDLSIRFPDDATGEYPHFAYIRVKMSTTDPNDAPYLNSLKVIVDMDIPKEMYVRTIKYNPKVTPMLGASAWSKFYSKFETEPSVIGSCELISEKVSIEHFDIITAKELPFYAHIPGLDSDKLNDLDLSVRYNYLMSDVNALNILKANKVYVKPYNYTINGQSKTHPMSFDEGIKFDNSPAYPIISANLNPFGNGLEMPLSEWIDYKFDYDNDVLVFNEVMNKYMNGNIPIKEGIAEYLPVGTLEVLYNPIFIQNLTSKDVGIREDSEGFILDYFKEEFIINESDVEKGYIPLKFPACDPIRELVIDDTEYLEDIHFTVDYINKRIEFLIIDDVQSSTLLTENQGKEMHVVYTPALEDAGLIIGYRGIRTSTDKQMKIYENYIEYKV